MKTNISGIQVNLRWTETMGTEFVPYLNFRRIDQFITYLSKQGKINDFSYDDLLKFIGQIEE